MKHIKKYRLFENVLDFPQLEDLSDTFRELKDKGFGVDFKECTSQKLNFSSEDGVIKPFISAHEVHSSPAYKTVEVVMVKISKKISAQDNPRYAGVGYKEFNINEIKETLKFIESYAKEELSLKLEYIYTIKVPTYLYFSSVDVLPNDRLFESITIAFSKKD